jgi:hypothetical protein
MNTRFLEWIRGGKSAAFIVTVPLLAILLLLLCSTVIADGGGGNPKDSIPNNYSSPDSLFIAGPTGSAVQSYESMTYPSYSKRAVQHDFQSWSTVWRRCFILYWIRQ